MKAACWLLSVAASGRWLCVNLSCWKGRYQVTEVKSGTRKWKRMDEGVTSNSIAFKFSFQLGQRSQLNQWCTAWRLAVWHWHLNGAETGEIQAPASGKGMRGRACSTGCTGICTPLCLCFSALWSNHWISCVALERWLVGALNSSWF